MEDEYIIDPLAEFNDTSRTYIQIKEYLSKPNDEGFPRVSKDTPWPIVTVWINKCIARFTNKKRYSKPREKIISLCIRYLDEIGYDF
jgi:hypothetical protein